jgi:hypothetical protein
MFRFIFKVLILILVFYSISYSQDSAKTNYKTIFLADVSVAENIENLSNYKIEAALSLAIYLINTASYQLRKLILF